MQQEIIKLVILFCILIISSNAFSCRVFENGIHWSADELIQKSESIVLAKLLHVENNGSFYFYTLEVIRILKGKNIESISFQGFKNGENSSNDFDDHTDSEFWTENVGRSDFPCCICSPNHMFYEDEIYLVFPDALGAMKSAEVINSDNDKWLKYVEKNL